VQKLEVPACLSGWCFIATRYSLAELLVRADDIGGEMTTKAQGIVAWHFVAETLRDGSPIPKDGVWLEHKGPIVICESGLHASREPFDALQYAPGATLCLVNVDGIEYEQDDKLVCRRRKIVARMDATEMLRYFSRMRALSVIHLWDTQPADVVLDYLMTGDEEIRAAAWAAARDAARDAARAAAWDAAWAAAWAAARDAARDAALDAAWAAARDAALDAAWAAARKDFNELTRECFWNYL
jgi:hypothetical protein